MKKHLLKLALLAVAGLAVLAPRAQAQETYIPDDLLLTVYQTGNSTEYTVDLGQASNYMTGGSDANSSAGNAISLGNFGADLTAVFGAGWNTSGTTFWSIVGAAGTIGENQTTGKTPQGEYADTLFGSNTETTPGTQSTAWSPSAAGAQGTAGGNIANYGSTLPQSSGSYNSNALTGPGAVVLLTGSGDSYYNQVSAQAGSGKAYAGFFGPGMEDTFSQGTGAGGATLDLFRLTATTRVNTPGNTAVIPPAGQVYVGSFNFTSAGVLDFSTSASSFAPIPEPSTYAFVGVGSLLLMAWYRRRIQRTMA